MYLVIRCDGCRTFTYVDRFQQWKLCPVCGGTINVRQSPTYLEVEDYSVAESVVSQLEEFLHRTKKKDLSPEEKTMLQQKYAQWLRNEI
jgi:tRNA G26 N,N-dimethylase Trm1